MHRIASIVLIVSMTVMVGSVLRLYWRGTKGASLRPTRPLLIVVMTCALVGIGDSILLLLH